ncbi:hypothetical protein ColTof4_14385 [Colletotrichum tofieldiae]|nr:hypothetical protein ColTof3_14798 [Colletotrichum tofieldiae]GKT81962.1 hypothetical protein ColTof4_14385 [Colletotrichum tofieldiae]
MDCFNGRSRFACIETVSRHLTLRNVNKEYRDNRGGCWTHATPPELSGSADQSYIPSLVKFDNIVGQVTLEDSWLWEVKAFEDPSVMLEQSAEMVRECVAEGSLWTVPNGRLYRRSPTGTWTSELGVLGGEEGLYGTLHNNQLIDMAPLEKDKEPDMAARSFDPSFTGFICLSHTSHTHDAGRVRRVICDTRVRILTERTVEQLLSMSLRTSVEVGEREWVLFIMGYYSRVDMVCINRLAVFHRLCAVSGLQTFSLHISKRNRICAISVSPGVLSKLTSSGVWADNMEVHCTDKLDR